MLKIRMPALLGTAVRVTGNLLIYKETEEAKQKSQYVLGLKELPAFHENNVVLSATETSVTSTVVSQDMASWSHEVVTVDRHMFRRNRQHIL